jgi:hypothetical protein
MQESNEKRKRGKDEKDLYVNIESIPYRTARKSQHLKPKLESVRDSDSQMRNDARAQGVSSKSEHPSLDHRRRVRLGSVSWALGCRPRVATLSLNRALRRGRRGSDVGGAAGHFGHD